MFHYQSPDGSNITAYSNQGIGREVMQISLAADQSETQYHDNYEYWHESKLRLVADYSWGDFALLEILSPIPPYFNLSFAGWNPSRFNNGIGFVAPIPTSPSRMITKHHPSGDIKKANGVNYGNYSQLPTALSCYTVATAIDVVFGWIWDRSVSTKSICKYVDDPWIYVLAYQYGRTEEGSSGAGLFNSDNRMVGVLSGGLATCNWLNPIKDFYGKL